MNNPLSGATCALLLLVFTTTANALQTLSFHGTLLYSSSSEELNLDAELIAAEDISPVPTLANSSVRIRLHYKFLDDSDPSLVTGLFVHTPSLSLEITDSSGVILLQGDSIFASSVGLSGFSLGQLAIAFDITGGSLSGLFPGTVDLVALSDNMDSVFSSTMFQTSFTALVNGEITVRDSDNDGVLDENDICPGFDDAVDSDGDGMPDGCDACPLDELNDADGDGVCGDVDICDGDDTVDTDNDTAPDDCDACPADPENDADGDGFCESVDNCPMISNGDQSDNDGDNTGDACDTDDDDDGVEDDADNCPLVNNNDQADFDGDGAGDVCDMDVDGDGVQDDLDSCPLTLGTAVVSGDGCSIDQNCACESNWKNHGAYVRCIVHTANDFIEQGLIDETEHGAITSYAANSSCGAKK